MGSFAVHVLLKANARWGVFATEIFVGFAPYRRVLRVGPDAFSRGPAAPRVGTLVLLLFGFLAGPAKSCDLQGRLGVHDWPTATIGEWL